MSILVLNRLGRCRADPEHSMPANASLLAASGLSGAKPDTVSPGRHASWVSLRSIQATECFVCLEKRTPGAAEVGSCLTDATRGDGSRRTVREKPLR